MGNCETKLASVRHNQTNFIHCTPNPSRNKYQISRWCPRRNHPSPPSECTAPQTPQGFSKFDGKGWRGSPHWQHIPEPPHPKNRRLTAPFPAVLNAKVQSVAHFYHPRSLSDLTAAEYGQSCIQLHSHWISRSVSSKPPRNQKQHHFFLEMRHLLRPSSCPCCKKTDCVLQQPYKTRITAAYSETFLKVRTCHKTTGHKWEFFNLCIRSHSKKRIFLVHYEVALYVFF